MKLGPHKKALRDAARKAKWKVYPDQARQTRTITAKGEIVRIGKKDSHFRIPKKAESSTIIKDNSIWSLKKLSKEQKEILEKELKKTKGEADVWVHPFFVTGQMEGTFVGKALNRKSYLRDILEGKIPANKSHIAEEGIQLERYQTLKNTFNYLRRSTKPLIVFVEKEKMRNTKEIFRGFNLKRPVIFIKTGMSTANNPKLTKKQAEIYSNYLKGKIASDQINIETLKIEKKINKTLSNQLSNLGIKKTNVFGELWYDNYSGCVPTALKILKSNKKIKTKLMKNNTYPRPD